MKHSCKTLGLAEVRSHDRIRTHVVRFHEIPPNPMGKQEYQSIQLNINIAHFSAMASNVQSWSSIDYAVTL